MRAALFAGLVLWAVSVYEGDGSASAPLSVPSLQAVDAPSPSTARQLPEDDGSGGAGLQFWLVWTLSDTAWTWVFQSVLESVLLYHPRARVGILSPTLPLDFFACFSAAGYNVSVVRVDIAALARGTAAEALAAPGGNLSRSRYGYVHQSDLARLLVLYEKGGTYVDTDMLFLRPLDAAVLGGAAVGRETITHHGFFDDTSDVRINNALLHFPEARHPLLGCMIERVAASFAPEEWACIGPDLLAQCRAAVGAAPRAGLRVLDRTAFYPLDWQHAFWIAGAGTKAEEWTSMLWAEGERDASYAVHLYTSNMDYGLQNHNGAATSYKTERGPTRGSLLEALVARTRLPGAEACPARALIADEAELRNGTVTRGGGAGVPTS